LLFLLFTINSCSTRSASLFFNTDDFQQPEGTKCKAPPDIGNIVNYAPFWSSGDQVYDSRWNLKWPRILMYKNYQAKMRIDMYNGKDEETTTSSYYMYYINIA
jgi:hypothetical protein